MGDLPVWLQLLLVFLVALGAALLCVPLAAAVGLSVGGGLVDRPRPGEVQRRPIGRTGGYGIIAAFFIGLVVGLPVIRAAQDRFLTDYPVEIAGPAILAEHQRLIGLVLGAIVLIPFAAWDDLRRLPPLPQLIGQIACAALPLIFGVRLTTISNPLPFGADPFPLGILIVPATLLWIIGMINAVNFLDTMDGLAGGVALIGASVLVLASLLIRVSFKEPQLTVAVLPLALAGACLGFLVFNFPPARIFMGTSGSMFLGYALGVISIIGGAKIATAVLVLGLPILDAAFVIASRILNRRSPMQGGDDAHLVHQLFAAGLSVRQIVALVYTLTALFGMLSLFLIRQQKLVGFAIVAGIISGLLLLLRRRNAEIALRQRQEPQV